MDVRQVIPKDAIPSVDDPEFGDRYDGDPEDEMVIVETYPARAYPVRYLNYHEIVNDAVGGQPFAVTWCPLCGSAVVYDRRVDGRTLTFGVSGKLADDDLVMYDRETASEWKQSSGECIAGELEGRRLDVQSMSVATWESFQRDYPEGIVLQRPGGKSEAASDTDEPAPIDYDENPYREYFGSDGFGLDAHRDQSGRDWDHSWLEPKTVVLGIEVEGDAVAYPRPTVEAAGGVVRDRVGDMDVVVFATDAGLHAFEAIATGFERSSQREFVAAGSVWNGVTGESTDGRRLQRIPGRRMFAFAWADDHGPGSFYR